MPELQPLEGTNYYLWFYVPQLWASLLFMAVFIVLTALHTWRMTKTKTWFCLPFVVGGIFELLGYAMRSYSYNNTGKILPYAFYSMATLLAPALFAASIYTVLGRLVGVFQTSPTLIVPEKWLTGLFVSGDLASFIVQGGGCGLMVMRDIRLVQIGEKVVVGGLLIQIIMFGLFVATTLIAQARLNQSGSSATMGDNAPKEAFFMLYAVSALIMIRSIFRLIEFIQGREGYLIQTEWPTLLFDAILMSLTMGLFFIRHPCRYIVPNPGPDAIEIGSVSLDLPASK